jgi:hypothetical protein
LAGGNLDGIHDRPDRKKRGWSLWSRCAGWPWRTLQSPDAAQTSRPAGPRFPFSARFALALRSTVWMVPFLMFLT